MRAPVIVIALVVVFGSAYIADIYWYHGANGRIVVHSIGLSDWCLQDIGKSRCTSVFEASKPLWMA